jgi:hypothetical protein
LIDIHWYPLISIDTVIWWTKTIWKLSVNGVSFCEHLISPEQRTVLVGWPLHCQVSKFVNSGWGTISPLCAHYIDGMKNVRT